MSLNESGFYSLIMIVGFGRWTALLILVGIMTVHNYSLLKTIVTLILSVIAH